VFRNSKDNNRQVGLKLQTYQDFLSMIYPIELRGNGRPGGLQSRNTYNAGVTLSQILTTRWQVLFLADLAYQQGYLGLPFNRVYFDDDTHGIEKLPDTRFKLPLGIRTSYFLGDRLVLRGFYRYYYDNWGLKAHTMEIETPVKVTPFISLSPFYRYYTQSGMKYFADYKIHRPQDRYYTSDFDLSTFDSHFIGMGFRWLSPEGVLGINRLNTLELRYGHYTRQTGLVSNIITLSGKFK
jgi:hypothetical protein